MSLEMEEDEVERFLVDNGGVGGSKTTAPPVTNGSNTNGSSSSGFSRRTKFLCVLCSILLVGLVLSGRTDERAVDNLELEDGDVQLKEPHAHNTTIIMR